jgi:hypothetical protein
VNNKLNVPDSSVLLNNIYEPYDKQFNRQLIEQHKPNFNENMNNPFFIKNLSYKKNNTPHNPNMRFMIDKEKYFE